MTCDGIKQVLVENQAELRVMGALDSDQRLEGFQCLDCTLEADRSWIDSSLDCCLSDDRADEIVGEQVRPYFLPYELPQEDPKRD